MRILDDAGWTLHRPRIRFRLRRRPSPGPLRKVSQRRGTGSWLASFVVFGAAVVAIAVAVSGLADRHGAAQSAAEAAPRGMNAAAGTPPGASVATIGISGETAPAVRRETGPRSATATPAAALAEPAEQPRPAVASAGGDASLFKLDRLPVLDGDGAGFDAEAAPTAAPARPIARAGQRKAPAPTSAPTSAR